MITPKHDDVHPPFGLLFTEKFLVMVDEYAGISKSVRRCPAQSTIAGETINWWYATGEVIWGNKRMEVAGPYGKPL